jgi:hypothetical protein
VAILISPEQMVVMRELWVLPQVEALLDRVQERRGLARPIHPEQGRRMVTDAVMTARRHHLTDPEALCRYATLVVQVGEDLGGGSAAAWSGPVLDDPWLSDAEKVSSLEQAALERGLLRS